MAFSSFSKDFTKNSFTSVENQFITKYLPTANGDAVRIYLYGLYLCNCAQDFDATSAAKLLGVTLQQLLDYFNFWEECGLVQILSRDPLYVEYLPVSTAIGKPKPIRPEKYADFNRELFKNLQKAGKDIRPYEQQRILEFLENNPIEPQAFLLIVEYYVNKQGAKLTVAHLLNAANKLVREHKYTFEQVEAEYSDFNINQEELCKIFDLLGIFRKPRDADYELLSSWKKAGMQSGAITACAKFLKKGSLNTLENLIKELFELNITTEKAAQDYLDERERLASIVFSVARNLSVKVQNPSPYIKQFAEKWTNQGFSEECISIVASLGFQLSFGFAELDALFSELYLNGNTDTDSVRSYCEKCNKNLRLLQKIQAVCGVIRKSKTTIATIENWKNVGFSDEMILEAAKRSANVAAPLPYMSKLLTEWKETGAFTVSEIPDRRKDKLIPRPEFRSEAAIAADERSERERFYATRRAKALKHVERATAIAEKDEAYRSAEALRKKYEIELAKAEVFSPDKVPEMQQKFQEAIAARTAALQKLQLTERDFTPKFTCDKCSDTGFLSNGHACDCYKK